MRSFYSGQAIRFSRRSKIQPPRGRLDHISSGNDVVGLGLIPLVVGIPLLVANANRKTSIKMALAKFNITSYTGNKQSANWGYQPAAAVGLSLTISF